MFRKYAALISGTILALSVAACTEETKEAPPPKENTQAPKQPAKAPQPKEQNAPAAPAQKPEPAPPTDNCGLDPADMDDKTKVQCGLVEEAPEPQTPGSENLPQDSLEFKCSDPTWRTNNGDYGDQQCGSDWDGSGSQPESFNNMGGMSCDVTATGEAYCQGPGAEQYMEQYNNGDSTPGSTGPETDGDTGRTQYEYGCEQGWIPADQC